MGAPTGAQGMVLGVRCLGWCKGEARGVIRRGSTASSRLVSRAGSGWDRVMNVPGPAPPFLSPENFSIEVSFCVQIVRGSSLNFCRSRRALGQRSARRVSGARRLQTGGAAPAPAFGKTAAERGSSPAAEQTLLRKSLLAGWAGAAVSRLSQLTPPIHHAGTPRRYTTGCRAYGH
eukprot:COSAG04_NODE_1288_length_7365_cov_12.007707_7_plen_175_part_00